LSHHKIVFSGPVGAGKTTAIAAVSDVPPVRTEAMASDEIRELKPTTTVAMDYGLLRLDGGEHIHLYGTPGQERFSFMWRILSEGALGVALLVSNYRPQPLADLRLYLDAFRPFLAQTRLAVGVTSMDRSAEPRLQDYHRTLSDAGMKAPVFEVDARERRDVSLLIQALLLSVDPCVESAPTDGA
jgi:signal recognition particle receptor subunit beta